MDAISQRKAELQRQLLEIEQEEEAAKIKAQKQSVSIGMTLTKEDRDKLDAIAQKAGCKLYRGCHYTNMIKAIINGELLLFRP